MDNFEGKHILTLNNRKELCLSGVTDVDSFDESQIDIKTSCGRLVIKGSELQIDSLDLKTSDMKIIGQIDSATYSSIITTKGRLKRMFS